MVESLDANVRPEVHIGAMSTVCTSPLCGQPVKVKSVGLCSTHYQLHRTGTGAPCPRGCGRVTGGGPCRPCKADRQPCSVDGCERTRAARGLCDVHYQRLRKGGTTDKRRVKRACLVDGCDRTVVGFGLCSTHWRRKRLYGDPLVCQRPPGGNGSVTGSGYRYLYRPGHPNANSRGQVMEHRAVMVEIVGRPLFDDETVHHANGDRLDNRPENLELWSSSQPAGQRVQDKTAWAVEILARYAPERLA